jgi:protein-S-isoprenylcysteine O-methyltransferase Ste14
MNAPSKIASAPRRPIAGQARAAEANIQRASSLGTTQQESIVSRKRFLHTTIDFGERLVVLVLFIVFTIRIYESPHFYHGNFLVILEESLDVAFILFRRRASTIALNPLAWAVALCGTVAPMLVHAGGNPLVPAAGGVLMLVGILITISAKLSLRRSFGLVAANRGVIHEGPYRFIRHPMYAGYIVTYIGFSIANPLSWNFLVYAFAISFQISRILVEESILRQDGSYVAMMSRVRYRLLPGVF